MSNLHELHVEHAVNLLAFVLDYRKFVLAAVRDASDTDIGRVLRMHRKVFEELCSQFEDLLSAFISRITPGVFS